MRFIEGPDKGGEPDIYIVRDSEGRSAEFERGIASLALMYLGSSGMETRAMAEDMLTGMAQRSCIPAHTVPLLHDMLSSHDSVLSRELQILRSARVMTRRSQYVSGRDVLEDLRSLRMLKGEKLATAFVTAEGLLADLTKDGIKLFLDDSHPARWSEEAQQAAIATGATVCSFQFEVVHRPEARDNSEPAYRLLSEREHLSIGKKVEGAYVPLATVLNTEHPIVVLAKSMGDRACGFATIVGRWNGLKLPKSA